MTQHLTTKKYVIEVLQDSDDDQSEDLEYYIKGVIVDLVSIKPAEEE